MNCQHQEFNISLQSVHYNGRTKVDSHDKCHYKGINSCQPQFATIGLYQALLSMINHDLFSHYKPLYLSITLWNQYLPSFNIMCHHLPSFTIIYHHYIIPSSTIIVSRQGVRWRQWVQPVPWSSFLVAAGILSGRWDDDDARVWKACRFQGGAQS